jgi:hypothetical protein
MPLRFQPLRLRAFSVFVATLLCGAAASIAQDSGIDLHANSHAGAAEIGLPLYPGATLYKDKDKDNDSAANLGLSFGDFHFSLLAADYVTSASPAQVFAIYRKPLSRYGEVLECDHGKPVGGLKVTRSGLTCSDKKDGHVQVNATDSSNDHELRAGSPLKFRIVGIDDSKGGPTRFGLVYLELPKESGDQGKSE